MTHARRLQIIILVFVLATFASIVALGAGPLLRYRAAKAAVEEFELTTKGKVTEALSLIDSSLLSGLGRSNGTPVCTYRAITPDVLEPKLKAYRSVMALLKEIHVKFEPVQQAIAEYNNSFIVGLGRDLGLVRRMEYEEASRPIEGYVVMDENALFQGPTAVLYRADYAVGEVEGTMCVCIQEEMRRAYRKHLREHPEEAVRMKIRRGSAVAGKLIGDAAQIESLPGGHKPHLFPEHSLRCPSNKTLANYVYPLVGDDGKSSL